MMVNIKFRSERAAVLVLFALSMAVGLLLSLPLERGTPGQVWVGGLLCGLGLGIWALFLSMGERPK